MSHALIIDDNMIVSRAIQDRLSSLGFHSFDQTWTEELAVAAAARREPDLVVVGDSVETGSALSAARRIAKQRSIPILMITADPGRLLQRIPKDTPFDGPFLLNEIEAAVALSHATG